jgi:hypothetical protein
VSAPLPWSFDPIQTHTSGTASPIPSASTIAITSRIPRPRSLSLVLSSLSATVGRRTKVPTPAFTNLLP